MSSELDPVSFSDEAFPSYVSISPFSNMGTYSESVPQAAKRGGVRKMCNAEINTEQLYYADAETNTKHKKKDAEVGKTLPLSLIFLLFRSKLRRTLTWPRWVTARTKATTMRTTESLRT